MMRERVLVLPKEDQRPLPINAEVCDKALPQLPSMFRLTIPTDAYQCRHADRPARRNEGQIAQGQPVKTHDRWHGEAFVGGTGPSGKLAGDEPNTAILTRHNVLPRP